MLVTKNVLHLYSLEQILVQNTSLTTLKRAEMLGLIDGNYAMCWALAIA